MSLLVQSAYWFVRLETFLFFGAGAVFAVAVPDTAGAGVALPPADGAGPVCVRSRALVLLPRGVVSFLQHVAVEMHAVVRKLVGSILLMPHHLDGEIGGRRRILVADEAYRGDRDSHQDQHRKERPNNLDE